MAYLIDIMIDQDSIRPGNMDVQHERDVAIADLLEENQFDLLTIETQGPFKLQIALIDNRLAFHIATDTDEHIVTHMLSLSPFKRIIKDYFLVCDSYYEAIKTSSPQKIEAIDMGRRGLHNDGSTLLQQRLKEKIDIDFETGRRLFTLICALHWKG